MRTIHTALTSSESSVVEQSLNTANGRQGKVLVPEVCLSNPLDVGGGDGVYVSLDLLWRVSLADRDHLSTNLGKVSNRSEIK